MAEFAFPFLLTNYLELVYSKAFTSHKSFVVQNYNYGELGLEI